MNRSGTSIKVLGRRADQILLETRMKDKLIIGPGCVIVNTSEMKDKGK